MKREGDALVLEESGEWVQWWGYVSVSLCLRVWRDKEESG